MYGMQEIEIDPRNSREGILALFAAIASRNTAATGLNDSSSRSHCFVWLTLYSYDTSNDRVRFSRFQFADLAGSERMRDAHAGFRGAMKAVSSGNTGPLEGLGTNYGLMMLSQRVRELGALARKGKASNHLVQRSFRTQLDPDVVVLLSESLTGAALTLVVVCVSAASANASQSTNALDFGKAFSGLRILPRKSPLQKASHLEAKARKLLAASAKAGVGANEKYAIIRRAQGRQGQLLKAILSKLKAS